MHVKNFNNYNKFEMHVQAVTMIFFHNVTEKKVKFFESQEVTVAPEERIKILMHSITEGKIIFSACCYKEN